MNELSTAYATQHDGNNGKSEWLVYNQDKKLIYKLPKSWTEKQVMVAIRMGRKFEVKSFNDGIEFQKALLPERILTLEAMVRNYEIGKEQMRTENLRLSNALDKLMVN